MGRIRIFWGGQRGFVDPSLWNGIGTILYAR